MNRGERLTHCFRCGKELTGKLKKFCSIECRNADKFVGPCRHCGATLPVGHTAYCSKDCMMARDVAIVDGAEVEVRTCTTCGEVKALESDYYKTSRGHPRRSCKACVIAVNGDYYQLSRRRESYLMGTYGITSSQYDELLAAQDGKCAVCGRQPTATRLAVDHDHHTGLVRGLLCNYCNLRVIGRTRDADLLYRAAGYLKEPPAERVLGRHAVPRRKKKRSRKTTTRRKVSR